MNRTVPRIRSFIVIEKSSASAPGQTGYTAISARHALMQFLEYAEVEIRREVDRCETMLAATKGDDDAT